MHRAFHASYLYRKLTIINFSNQWSCNFEGEGSLFWTKSYTHTTSLSKKRHLSPKLLSKAFAGEGDTVFLQIHILDEYFNNVAY